MSETVPSDLSNLVSDSNSAANAKADWRALCTEVGEFNTHDVFEELDIPSQFLAPDWSKDLNKEWEQDANECGIALEN